MPCRRRSRLMPPAIRARSAAAVVRRSSTISTGRPDACRMAAASLCAAAASGPRVPSSRRGSPTMMRSASWLRAASATRLAKVASGSACRVASGCAMVSVGSLKATPTRFDPGSTARILKPTMEKPLASGMPSRRARSSAAPRPTARRNGSRCALKGQASAAMSSATL